MKIVFDTNALLSFSHLLNNDDEIIIPIIVIDELDNLKSGFTEKSYRAREAVRKIKKLSNLYIDPVFSRNHKLVDNSKYGKNDDVIIECAKTHNASLVTGDYIVEIKAKAENINVIDTLGNQNDDYTGYREFIIEENEIDSFHFNIHKHGFQINQYVILKDASEEIIEIAKWNGNSLQRCKPEDIKTIMFGNFKAFDEFQVCALDSLQTNQMTMIKGKAGSGKSIITLNYAWNEIENNKYDKLIIFTNPVASKNSAKLGYYPGTRLEKLMESQTGTMLTSKFGDESEVYKQIEANKLALLPFSDIRGFDTTGMKALIWFIECQNLDVELMKLGISRVGDDCKIILDGDYSGQVDMEAYAGYNNGMRRVSEVFRGQDFYGEVQLNYVHRSKMAARADFL
ncbi:MULTISPECIES: PhoH family protein [unclassified Paenibacillus]|uniref:PhoH family protein n=1 Tax=unclassified Paenibacillus TaxID=185978 RepID=UPI0036D3F494